MTKEALGTWGENEALDYLRRKGYRFIDRNIRFKKFEVDLILKDQDEIVIVEVKARSTNLMGEPWQAVSKTKQRQIITVADQYVQAHQLNNNIRFDIVSIVHNAHQTNIEHIVDAFSA
ncbi:MAG: YraN family protein [Crocinitomicaceae bacterium]